MVAGAVTVDAGLLVGGSSAPAQDENSEKNAGALLKVMPRFFDFWPLQKSSRATLVAVPGARG